MEYGCSVAFSLIKVNRVLFMTVQNIEFDYFPVKSLAPKGRPLNIITFY